jgi:uncharacterized protein
MLGQVLRKAQPTLGVPYMRLDLDMGDNTNNQIRAYDTEKIQVNDEIFTQSIIVTATLVMLWNPKSIEHLTTADMQIIAALNPEIVILGTGSKLSFPAPAILSPLTQQNIGVEIMTTAAACRTYDILMSEGRRVVAGLIIG